jgi:hypothetical protein
MPTRSGAKRRETNKADTMGGRQALVTVWRAVVAGLTVARGAERCAYYNLPMADGPAPALTTPR